MRAFVRCVCAWVCVLGMCVASASVVVEPPIRVSVCWCRVCVCVCVRRSRSWSPPRAAGGRHRRLVRMRRSLTGPAGLLVDQMGGPCAARQHMRGSRGGVRGPGGRPSVRGPAWRVRCRVAPPFAHSSPHRVFGHQDPTLLEYGGRRRGDYRRRRLRRVRRARLRRESRRERSRRLQPREHAREVLLGRARRRERESRTLGSGREFPTGATVGGGSGRWDNTHTHTPVARPRGAPNRSRASPATAAEAARARRGACTRARWSFARIHANRGQRCSNAH